MKKYVCDMCGWEYDPEVGDPENGIEPGTAFVCPMISFARSAALARMNSLQ